MERDSATDLAEEVYSECIEPFLSDLGTLEAQLALEKKIREIILNEREACAKEVDKHLIGFRDQYLYDRDVAKTIRSRK